MGSRAIRATSRVAARLLAICRGTRALPDQRTLQTGKKNVGINLIEPVGNYAIRIGFDDGHGSGIYAWAYLHELGSQQERLWQEYLQELKQANASRLPNIPVSQLRPK